MPESHRSSPLALLNEDLDATAIRKLTQDLLTRVKGPFDPDIESRCALAILKAQSGQLAQARNLLDEARLIDPLNLMPYNLRIQLESQAGPPGEGDRWMRRHARVEGARAKGRRHHKDDVPEILKRTVRLAQSGRLQDVADIIEDFLFTDTLGPGLDRETSSDLYHRLAEYNTQLGWAEAAWRCRNAAVILNPKNREAVQAYLDHMPVDPQWSLVPEATTEAWDLPEEEGAIEAAHALTDAGITAAHHREFLQRTARLPIHDMDILDLGDGLPIAFTQTLGAHSWVAQADHLEAETVGTFSLGPVDLKSLPDAAFDSAFVNGNALADPKAAIAVLARVLRPGGQAVVLLGPSRSSAWGHGLTKKGKDAPAPHWSHLIWDDEDRAAFAAQCGIHPAALTGDAKIPLATDLIALLEPEGLVMKSQRVIRRNFPVPHLQLALEEKLPAEGNLHDWGYELIFERP